MHEIVIIDIRAIQKFGFFSQQKMNRWLSLIPHNKIFDRVHLILSLNYIFSPNPYFKIIPLGKNKSHLLCGFQNVQDFFSFINISQFNSIIRPQDIKIYDFSINYSGKIINEKKLDINNDFTLILNSNNSFYANSSFSESVIKNTCTDACFELNFVRNSEETFFYLIRNNNIINLSDLAQYLDLAKTLSVNLILSTGEIVYHNSNSIFHLNNKKEVIISGFVIEDANYESTLCHSIAASNNLPILNLFQIKTISKYMNLKLVKGFNSGISLQDLNIFKSCTHNLYDDLDITLLYQMKNVIPSRLEQMY